MRAWLVLLIVATAGCTAPVSDTQSEAPQMVIHGTVLDYALQPIRAQLHLQELNLTVFSSQAGLFQFPPVEPDLYTLHISAAGHASITWNVFPSAGNVSLMLRLEGLLTEPTHYSEHVRGHMQCMAEYVIISGDCDRLADYVNNEYPDGRPMPEPFEGNETTRFDVPQQWRTLVIDLEFDASAQPGFDGMRVSVYGLQGDAEVLDYERIIQESNPESFTLRLDAGETYESPVPFNQTSFRIEVYAQGHGYKTVCAAEDCFLGTGAGLDVAYDLYLTTFLVEPAPEAWSLL